MASPEHLVVDLTSDDEGIVDGGPDWDAMAAMSYADLDLQDAIVVIFYSIPYYRLAFSGHYRPFYQL